jgi:hypothetical protein
MKAKRLVIVCAAVSFSQLVYSAESFFDKLTLAPTVAVKMKNLSFDLDHIKGTSSLLASASGDFEVHMPVLSLGLTAAYDRFYIAIKRDDSFDDALTTSTVPFTGGKSTVQREDMNLTFGMNVAGGVNIFVGYMDGETTLTNITGFASTQSPRYTQEYQEDGFFAGASYNLPVEEVGTLTFSTAYAFMDGVYEDNFATQGRVLEYDGDSEGMSLGVTWSAPLTERIGYFIDLRYQSYYFEGDAANGNFVGSEVEAEEEMLTYSAGLQWYF